MFLYKRAHRERVSKIPNRRFQENIASTPKSDLDGQQKNIIVRIGAKGVRGSSCTKPNISSVALRAGAGSSLQGFTIFFALEVLLFWEAFTCNTEWVCPHNILVVLARQKLLSEKYTKTKKYSH